MFLGARYITSHRAAAGVVSLAAIAQNVGGEETAVCKEDRVDYWMKKQGEHSYLEDVQGERALSWVKDENSKVDFQ